MRSLHSVPPLNEPTLFTDVYLLPRPNQPNNNTPLGNTLRKLDEVLGFRPAITAAVVFARDLVRIERALRLIENEHVFGRDEIGPLRVRGYVRFDVPNKGLSSTAGPTQFVLENLDEGAVAREVDSRRRWPAVGSFDSQVIEEPRMGELETYQCLPCTRKARKKHKPSGLGPRGIPRDLRDQL